MPPLPPCLTIQFYSSNQLLFPVISPISSSSIHLRASFTINLPLLFLLEEFGNIISFAIRLYKHVFHFNKLVSQLVSHSSTTALIVVSLTPCSLHVKQDSKARIVHVGWIEQQLFRTSFIRTPWNWCFLKWWPRRDRRFTKQSPQLGITQLGSTQTGYTKLVNATWNSTHMDTDFILRLPRNISQSKQVPGYPTHKTRGNFIAGSWSSYS